jgi:hypothetical protein
MKEKAIKVYGGAMLAFILVLSSLGMTNISFGAAGASGRAVEGTDNDASNNDDYATAQTISSGDIITGTTGLGDSHRIDTFVLKNVPAGKVINASLLITNFNNQALQLTGWNRFHIDALAWSNREDNPERRQWEAVSFLCVVTGDYYLQLKPIAGTGTMNYALHIQAFDPPDITSNIGSGGTFGATIQGQVSSLKWYPGVWYKFTMTGEQGGMNDYLYVNMTEPGAPDQRLWGDLYVRDIQAETFSYWLNHSWWLDSFVQYEEVHAAACHPGTKTYYLDVQAFNTSGGRSENFELRMSKTQIESDGDNDITGATKVTYDSGKTTIKRFGNVSRGTDQFDWYKCYLNKGEGVSANLTLLEKSTAIFRLSIYRDNLTATTPEKGYDLMSSWTNKPADTVLNRVNALTTNVTQEGWYYIGVIAQIGLVPHNVSNLSDWTLCTAWAKYQLDITLPDRTVAPTIRNEPGQITIPEDGTDSSLKLNGTAGVFDDADFTQEWGDALSFSSSGNPNFQISIANYSTDPEAPVTIKPNANWNGEANITFTATDLYGKSNSTTVRLRVTPANDPPFVKARIPDFIVSEGSINNTMKDIDLFQVFSDPDFPPFGDDNLTFTVDNSSYPAFVLDNKLTFGQAPSFPGKDNHVVVATVTAKDKAGQTCAMAINITVINLNRAPEYNESGNTAWINEDAVSYFDLNKLFWDPDGDSLVFAFLGGASDNLTVDIAPNGSAVFTPSKDYYVAQEIIRFRAIDPVGANKSGELMVRIINVNDAPYLLQGGMVPDPLEELAMNEGEQMTFRVSAADIDNKTSELKYTWMVDNVEKTKLGTPAFTWRAAFNDSGTHVVKVRISDGLAFTDAEWNLKVNNTNQIPQITDGPWPQNNTEVDAGKKLNFCATANDPDGDPLTFTWRLSDGTTLKTDSGKTTSQFGKVLASGKQHIVVLEVSDGQGGVNRMYIYVKVRAQAKNTGFIPGFETAAMGLAMAVAALGVAMYRRKEE